ncbi:MAG TPA: hypothetical protein VGK00_11125 [Anaerolineales bacterium]|jgi:hypothetical protein
MNRPWIFLFGLSVSLVACSPAPVLPPPTAEPSATAIPIASAIVQTPTQQITTTPDSPETDGLFQKITQSTDILHTQCDPLEIIFDVTVNSSEITNVVFFFRMKDKASGMVIPWSNGESMRSAGNGTFEFIFRSSAIPNEARYNEAWVQYQFVGVDRNLKNIGHSQIFSEKLTFKPGCP